MKSEPPKESGASVRRIATQAASILLAALILGFLFNAVNPDGLWLGGFGGF